MSPKIILELQMFIAMMSSFLMVLGIQTQSSCLHTHVLLPSPSPIECFVVLFCSTDTAGEKKEDSDNLYDSLCLI